MPEYDLHIMITDEMIHGKGQSLTNLEKFDKR